MKPIKTLSLYDWGTSFRNDSFPMYKTVICKNLGNMHFKDVPMIKSWETFWSLDSMPRVLQFGKAANFSTLRPETDFEQETMLTQDHLTMPYKFGTKGTKNWEGQKNGNHGVQRSDLVSRTLSRGDWLKIERLLFASQLTGPLNSHRTHYNLRNRNNVQSILLSPCHMMSVCVRLCLCIRSRWFGDMQEVNKAPNTSFQAVFPL